MYYRFLLQYQAVDSNISSSRLCRPLYSDELAVSLDRASGEWYYQRKLEGKLTFVRNDYNYIMAQPLDGTFRLVVQNSIDDSATTWANYVEGTFSRINLEIDEDHQTAVLNGLTEGIYNIIENGRREEYDLMKIIPESEAKEVESTVPPVLALVDYRQAAISKSDIYTGTHATAGGYKAAYQEEEWNEYVQVTTDDRWALVGIRAEAKVEAYDNSDPLAAGTYAGNLSYGTYGPDGSQLCPQGIIAGPNGYTMYVGGYYNEDRDENYIIAEIYDPNGDTVATCERPAPGHQWYSPAALVLSTNSYDVYVVLHYIRASVLTQSYGSQSNILDTGDYYKKMFAANPSGLVVRTSLVTTDQPNGHRMVPGSDENGGAAAYFAPPDSARNWMPLAEDNWNYASLWFAADSSVDTYLSNPDFAGSFRWTRCWTLGTCIKYLLKKITGDKVYFDEHTSSSRFLYTPTNPLTGGEPFDYLVTQKSNVMRPGNNGSSAARCIVTLDWFLTLLRNAFNCYWYLKEGNRDRYTMVIEHVEYFRRGGSYTVGPTGLTDLTLIKPRRNFLRGGQPAKRLSDGIRKYSYNLDGMTEKYTYSWQGEGGSDDFKGHPMTFRAGWIEKSSSENRQVDNIFADLGWLMANAGTDAASSKNYDGLMLFAGYRAAGSGWSENSACRQRIVPLSDFLRGTSMCFGICVTVPEGQTFTIELYRTVPHQEVIHLATCVGTGSRQTLWQYINFPSAFSSMARLNFGADYGNVTIHRLRNCTTGNSYRVASVENLLGSGYLLNGVLSWSQLQTQYLHYDIPAKRWSYDSDDPAEATYQDTGTVKLAKQQTVGLLPLTDTYRGEEEKLTYGVKGGLRGTGGGLLVGITSSVRINLGSRNGELTILYDPTE